MDELNLEIRKGKEVSIVVHSEFSERHTIEEAEQLRNQLTRLIRSARAMQREINKVGEKCDE